jgi:glucokinase
MSPGETIGLDLGGTKLLVGVLDADRQVLWERRERSTGLSEESLIDLIAREVGEAREARPDAGAVGLGIPATIDHERGIAIAAVNLPIDDWPIRELLEERIGAPVFVDNDANLAMLAEHLYGAAREARNAVMITVGTGIGGGLIVNGRLYRGTIGAGAELGHVVIDIDGPPCQGLCPGRGHVEAVASGTAMGMEGRTAAAAAPDSALGRLLAEGQEIDGKAVTAAAIGGDESARQVVETIGRRIGAALTGFANIFAPDVMVVGGGVIAAGEMLLEPARREVSERALRPMNETPIVAAELGADAGMIGAAAMARIEADEQAQG